MDNPGLKPTKPTLVPVLMYEDQVTKQQYRSREEWRDAQIGNILTKRLYPQSSSGLRYGPPYADVSNVVRNWDQITREVNELG